MLSIEERARRHAWRRACAICGTAFGWSKNGDAAIYCGRICAGRAVGKIIIGAKLHRHHTCEHCGKAFADYYDIRRYCSRTCTSASRRGIPVRRGAGGRTDQNQGAIVAALRAAGASVLDTSRLGGGFPDLIIGYQGINILCEVKNPKNGYGRRGLNKNQLEWAANWRGGPVALVRDIEGALRILAVVRAAGSQGLVRLASAENVVNSVEEALALVEE